MKILRLTTLLDFGGQEQQYLSFTENSSLLQNDYVFVAIGHGGNAEKTLRERGFEVHILNRNFSIRNLSNIWTVYKLIKKVKPDVVHTAAAEANFFGILAAKLAGVRVIIGEEIGIPNHSKMAQKVFRFVYLFSDKVIGVSKSVINHLIHTKEISVGKGEVIYNPVSIPKKFVAEETHFLEMVYVGRLEKVKNVKTLIEAFARIENSNCRLTIVGDGRERENIQSIILSLNLTDKVDLVGFSNEPSRYLSNADVFVLPSYSEGFGIAAVEAMFLKVPVVCSNVGGIPEFVFHGENGWLFNPNSVDDLVLKLEYILNLSKEELKSVGVNGYNSVIDTYTVGKYIYNLENFYNELSK